MTITTSESCESITITSDYLDAGNQSVTLSITTNCTEEYSIVVDVEDTEIVVDQDALGLSGDTLDDGIYYLKLTIIQETSDKVVETACTFVNCVTTCLMQDTLNAAVEKDADAMIRALAFHALVASESCTSCACADLCTLYTIATETCEDDTTSPCGCS